MNAVAFGFVETRLTAPRRTRARSSATGSRSSSGSRGTCASWPRRSSRSGARRTPEEAAGAIFFLCSPWSNFVHGQVLTVERRPDDGDDVSVRLAAVGRPAEESVTRWGQEALRAYAAATDDAPRRAGVCAPALVGRSAGQVSRAVALGRGSPRVVHYEQDLVQHRPLEPVMAVSRALTPVALLPGPNGTSLVIQTETRDEDGVARQRAVHDGVLPGGGGAGEGRRARARPPRSRRRRSSVAEITYPVAETRRSGTRRRRVTSSRSTSTTTSRAPSGSPAGSSTGSARWRSPAARCSRPPGSRIRHRAAGSRFASRRRSSPATR